MNPSDSIFQGASETYPPAPQQPAATGVPVSTTRQDHHGQRGAWSSDLCDCFSDVPSCCLTCWCPCISFGRIAEIVDQGATTCTTGGAIYAILAYFTGYACIYSCVYRSKLRKQYALEERPCNDCLVHCCCESCALCQEYRELQSRGFDMALGWEGNMQRQSRGMEMTAPPAQLMGGAMK
uniref:Protein PLANT CADMIUM RESISTANCE 2-like n=1 Tax=Rhizophora mucronata TaxID=61149 RepID=A0A2P2MA66_RHIMU